MNVTEEAADIVQDVTDTVGKVSDDDDDLAPSDVSPSKPEILGQNGSSLTAVAPDSYSGDQSSATEDLEDSKGSGGGGSSGVTSGVRKRKKRRRSSKSGKVANTDDQETGAAASDAKAVSVKVKGLQIEAALRWGGSGRGSAGRQSSILAFQKQALLAAADDSSASDGGGGPGGASLASSSSSPPFKTLNDLAISERGLINDDFRRRAWPRLANLNIYETSLLPTQEEVEAHKSYNQVVLDVNRSLKRFPPGISESERPDLQDQLTRLIVRVLSKHEDLHYYQGYHDVAITFLLVVGEQLAYHIVEKLSAKQLKDFMAPTMEKTTFLLHFIYPILRRECEPLHDFLDESEVGTIFALPWLITWFSHVLPDYADVVRLFDFFLAQPDKPMMPVYLAAALVLHRKIEVLNCDCDMASVHSLLSTIPPDICLETILLEARRLYDLHPPFTLQPEVEARVARLEAEAKAAMEAADRKRALIQRRMAEAKAKAEAEIAAKKRRENAWRVILLAVPAVLIGALAWKLLEYHNSTLI